MTQRRTLLKTSLALCAGLGPTLAGAQAAPYPNRPLRLVLPFTTGGPADVIARLVADRLQGALKQPLVVVNTAGAGGMIASQQVAQSAPDGYTLFYANASTLTIAPQLAAKPGPEPWNLFVPIAPLLSFSLILAAHPSVPANNLKELITYARANPDKLSFASPGVGTTPHLVGELLKREAGLKMVHVAYKGAAPAILDLLAGRVDLFFDQPLTLVPHLKTGKLKAFAVTSRARMPSLPEVPTVAELGMPELSLQSWSGLVAPMGTPREVIALLSQEVQKILDTAEMREAIVSRGLDPLRGSPEDFGRMIREDYPRWGSLIRAQNIVAE